MSLLKSQKTCFPLPDASPPLPGRALPMVEKRFFTSRSPLSLECGRALPEWTLAYETYGQPNADASNAILILHGLSADAHAAGYHASDDSKPGWWDAMIGPGKPIDTDRFWVLCANVLGGCYGSTGPSSINPETGRPYGMGFPMVTIGDMVAAQKCLLDHLGIRRLHAAIGGSLGGFQTLEWSLRYPDLVERAVCIASGPQLTAQGIAFNAVGRQAIMQDPNWKQGRYYGTGARIDGLATARMLAHITYFSDGMLNERFGRTLREPEKLRYSVSDEFAVESYLTYKGRKFSEQFDANSYLYLTKAMDYFDIAAAYGPLETAFEKASARYLVIAFSTDWLFPPTEARRMAEAIRRSGKASEFLEIETLYGHDAFLMEEPEMNERIQQFLR